MTITHDDRPTLTGPMSKSEYLDFLYTHLGFTTKFIDRKKSSNTVHPYSWIGEGYIILQLQETGPGLYDSIQHPESYLRTTDDWAVVVGRHTKYGEYFAIDSNWSGISSVAMSHYGIDIL